MKKLKAKAERVVQEYLASQPKPPIAIATCSSEYWDRLRSERASSPPFAPVRRGHPFELDDNRTAAFGSLAAALLVDNLRQQFLKQYCNIKRVRIVATNVFIRFAMQNYPKASRHTIIERLRLRKKCIFSGGLGRFDVELGTRRRISDRCVDGPAFHPVRITKHSWRRNSDCLFVGTTIKHRPESIQVFSGRNTTTG
jgi:hypothetical protein